MRLLGMDASICLTPSPSPPSLPPSVLLSIDAEPFDKGGTSEIFRGNFEGRSVAVKVPMFRCFFVCVFLYFYTSVYISFFPSIYQSIYPSIYLYAHKVAYA